MNPLNHPAAHQIPENDIEKRGELKDPSVNIILSSNSPEDSQISDVAPTPVILTGRLAKWNAKVEGLAGLGTYTRSAFSLLGQIMCLEEPLRSSTFKTCFKAPYVAPFLSSPSQTILIKSISRGSWYLKSTVGHKF